MADENKNILATRTHATLSERLTQINLNWLCYKAGKPYITARLHRGIHEDDGSWNGITDTAGTVIVPSRINRSHFVPYPSRIVDKIEEHIYASPIKRDQADDFFLKNTDRTGRDVNGVMKALFEYWTVCGWAWLGVDRTSATGEPSNTVAEKERNKDGVFWTVYAPWEVVDWSFDDSGNIRWLITQRGYLENEDPAVEAKALTVRTLWKAGGVGERMTLDTGGAVISQEPFEIPYNGVPFRLIGEISSDPHWFDSVEMIAASLLNMESEAHTNLSKGVYALPVVPADVANGGASSGLGKGKETVEATDAKVTVQKIYGRKNPIFEDESSKGTTRFVSPEQGDMDAYPSEIERTKKALYEVAGLGVSKQKDTADAESADAKQFDHLDINAVLRDIAQQLQRIEEMAVEMSVSFDREFKAYEPVYPTEFNVIDFASMMAGVEKMDALGIQLPKTLRVAIVRALSENIPNMSETERKAIEAEVQEMLDGEDDAAKRIAGAAVATGATGAEVVADTALNGAHVSSLVEIINAVVSGQMPSETAKAAIAAAFPGVDDKTIQAIVGPLLKFKPAVPVEPQASV